MFLYSRWLQLPLTTRHKLAAHFGIIKRGSTEVFDNQIKSDGYLVKEIEEALNIDAIQKYLGVAETDMLTLWMWLIEKIEDRPLTQVNIDTTTAEINKTFDENFIETINKLEIVDPTSPKYVAIKPKRGRPKKNV